MKRIMWQHMFPCGHRNDIEYAVSQYISAYLNSKGVQGVKYASFHNPKEQSFNMVLFAPLLARCISEHGTVYRCVSEQKRYQNMTTGLHEDGRFIQSERSSPVLGDNEIENIRKRMIKQVSEESKD